MATVIVKLRGMAVRDKLAALAEHYGIGRERLQALSVPEFAALVALAKGRGGSS